MSHNRRTFFLASASFAAAGGALHRAVGQGQDTSPPTGPRPLVVSTWPFGKPGNERALEVLQAGGSTLDAVEQGVRLIEASGNTSVGLSGKPNAAGYVQLDACIMHGPGHQAGSVAALEGIAHPITAARRVMENTRHVMLVGEGARWFALQEGLESVAIENDEALKNAWLEERVPGNARGGQGGSAENHDTITLLVLGADGTISGGCSTSGLADKLPGRVGDSPILGSGLYVDNEVGAAGATGTGENVMRYCASFLIVELMRTGLHPTEACRRAIDRIASTDPLAKNLDINFIALDKYGRHGAAGSKDFPYSVTYPGYSEVVTMPA